MKILVTGATGFIGGHLVESLLAQGHQVRALVSPRRNLETVNSLKNIGVEVFRGDLTRPESLVGVGEQVEVLFHLGAIVRGGKTSDYSEVNKNGTVHLFQAFRRPPKRIILMSSLSAVGPYQGTPLDEKSPCCPVDAYGLSKLTQENVAAEYCKERGVSLVVLRLPPVYGSGDKDSAMWLKVVDARLFPIRNSEPCMDYIYVENLVGACLLVMETGEGLYHVSDRRKYSLNEILSCVARLKGKRLLPVYLPKTLFVGLARMIDYLSKSFGISPPFSLTSVRWMTERYWYSNTSRIEALGYRAPFDLREGMARLVRGKKPVDFHP